MYRGYGFIDWGIGDVDVIKVNGQYHLFHLVLPNHDFIAHAVSDDGLSWQRVKNALFIGDPGSWDDDMLWTMHVSPNPYGEGWRMFYTGLCQRERGRVQRIGLATSTDLYHWEKQNDAYPIDISGEYYESTLKEGRHWVSFRDPFIYQEDGTCYLLASARVKEGPIIRRGCVALAEEVAKNQFEFRPPLYHPRIYDDVEVPSLVKFGERYYLLGAIREDVKIHYWHSEHLDGYYENFFDNVLLPQGNYAARICRDGERVLLWNFFFTERRADGRGNLLPPPKELVVDDNGELRVKSFGGFDSRVCEQLSLGDLTPLEPLTGNEKAKGAVDDASCFFGSSSAFEAFLFQGNYDNFRLRGELKMRGRGKCGLVLRIDESANGYFLSLDLFKGIAQLRAWYANENGSVENAFTYNQLQSSYFIGRGEGPYRLELLAFGKYLEFSLDGYVVLSLADDTFEQGRIGFYVESAEISVDNVGLECLNAPESDDYDQVS